MNLNEGLEKDKVIFDAIENELNRQRNNLEMIASENIVSKAVMQAQGSVLTLKYDEGYPGKRYYGGCKYVDIVEQTAIDRAKELFHANFANVQPHSGAQSNMATFLALLDIGDKVLGMNLTDGGHLSHTSPVNFSGKYFNVATYGVSKETETIDYAEVEKKAVEFQPKLIIAGASAYSRIIDFERFSYIAKKVGAYLLTDIAHIAGLVAGGVHPSPMEFADVVTTTTHKTLRGPRGGIIIWNNENYTKKINSAVFPQTQGGSLPHVIAAKAVALGEALEPEFKDYAAQIVKNAKTLAAKLAADGFRIVSGGTDNHLMLVDLTSKGITGKEAQALLEDVNITVNKNTIPFETLSPFVTSGIRIGTPALTTRGFKEDDMSEVADIIAMVLNNPADDAKKVSARERVAALCKKYPLY